MRLPLTGSFIRVLWRDIEHGEGWEEPDEESPRTIEITTGVLRGITVDQKVRIAPTVSVRLDTQKIDSKFGEMQIPAGSIVMVERLVAEPIDADAAGHEYPTHPKVR